MADTEASSKPIQVKLVLLGEAAVGKSSLVMRFVSNDFNENNSPTIGAAFLTQKCRLEDKVIKFEIWDTAGQERFHSLAPMYYRNAAAAVVVYDITKAASLEKAQKWVTELQRQANPNIVIALVGNKLDLITDAPPTSPSPFLTTPADPSSDSSPSETEEDDSAPQSPTSTAVASAGESLRQVSREEGESYAREAGGLLFFEASAKTGKGVQEIFTEIAKNLPTETTTAKNGAPAAGGAAGARRAAKVNLGEGEVKKGGCC